MINILPDYVRWFWVIGYLLVFAQHFSHTVRMTGMHRVWHSGHLLMALGMIYMFIPPRFVDPTPRVWTLLYTLVTLAAAGYAVIESRRGRRIEIAWITLTVGLGMMAYMWGMMAGGAMAPVSYLGAAWFAAEAVGWFSEQLCGRNTLGWLPQGIGGTRRNRPQDTEFLAGAEPVACGTSLTGCVTLGLMAVGMSYMLIGMQLMV